MAKIDILFKLMRDKGASDLHLRDGSPPMLRINGTLQTINVQGLSSGANQILIYEIMSAEQRKYFEDTCDVDFAYDAPGIARFRCNAFRQHRGIGAVFRLIPSKIISAEELGLPQSVLHLAEIPKGLVVVTGPTGSGKSTTLAAIIDYINTRRKDHIVTIEDPLEFVHPAKGCLVSQREVGTHTKSFSVALRAALREDPDIIMVGEMRDLETIELAISAAETGHLVYGTLHTISAAKTVDRIIDSFPSDKQQQMRTMLSESLKGVVAQQLLKRADGKGRCAAFEILIGTAALGNLIREGKTFQIPSVIQSGRNLGMQSMDQALTELLKEKKISPEVAYAMAENKSSFEQFLATGGDSSPGSATTLSPVQ